MSLLSVYLRLGIHGIIHDEKKSRRLVGDVQEAGESEREVPAVSVGPSGIDGPYQKQWP